MRVALRLQTEAIMFQQAFARAAAVRVGILGSVVLGIGIASVQPSLAGCEAV